MKRSFCAWAFCLMAAGCSATGDVKGTVNYKGKALTHGSITAYVAGAAPVQAEIDSEGKYELKAVPVGKAKFIIICQDPTLSKTLSDAAKKGKEALEAGGDAKKKAEGGGRMPSIPQVSNISMIPEKYSDAKKELLTFDVVKGENKYDIVLEP